jgi:hypothetical protein
MTSSQHAGTLPDWGVDDMMADGVPDPNTTRGMAICPVNPQKATSVVGHSPYREDEFVVTRLSFSRPNHTGESPDDRDSKGHRGNNSTGNRGKGDWGKDGGKDHQRLEIRREERKTPDNRSSKE